MKSLLPFLLVFFLAACASSTAPTHPDPLAFASQQPGAHVSLAPAPPPGFSAVSAPEIFALHRSQQAIWLHAPAGELSASGMEAWLNAAHALHFSNADQDLYWIPPTADADTLSFAESLDITGWLAPEQQQFLWRRRGDTQRQRQDFAAAVQSYQIVLVVDDQDAVAYAGLGAALLGLGRNEEAATALEQASALTPDDYWAHRLLGNAYLKLLRYPLALDELTQAYILRPDDPHLLLGIALAQGRMGDTATALNTLQQLLARSASPQDRADVKKLQAEFSSGTP